MQNLSFERDGDLVVLRLTKARGHSLDEALLMELRESVARVRNDQSVQGVMLAASHPRVFCTGLDLEALQDWDRLRMRGFMRLFCEVMRDLFGLDRPLVAALSGHAVAGGLVLALTADLRILKGAEVMVGLNELRVGLPMPWTVVLLLQATVPGRSFSEVALLGRNFTGEEAVERGLAHEVGPKEGFEAHCLERLRDVASREAGAIRLTKAWSRLAALERMAAGEEAHLEAFLDAWFSDPVQQRLRTTLDALRAKRG